ncbi:hypothetical protein EMMF5_000295 [Cystobasidiomycetes sp. EMM_F5]
MIELLDLPSEVLYNIGLFCLSKDMCNQSEVCIPRLRDRLRLPGNPRRLLTLRALSCCSSRLLELVTPLLYNQLDISGAKGLDFHETLGLPQPLSLRQGSIKHLVIRDSQACRDSCRFSSRSTLLSHVTAVTLWHYTHIAQCLWDELRRSATNIKVLSVLFDDYFNDVSESPHWLDLLKRLQELSRLVIYSGDEFATVEEEALALSTIASHLDDAKFSQLEVVDALAPFPFSYHVIARLQTLDITVRQVEYLIPFVAEHTSVLHMLRTLRIRIGRDELDHTYRDECDVSTVLAQCKNLVIADVPFCALDNETCLCSLPESLQEIRFYEVGDRRTSLMRLRCFLGNEDHLPNLRIFVLDIAAKNFRFLAQEWWEFAQGFDLFMITSRANICHSGQALSPQILGMSTIRH